MKKTRMLLIFGIAMLGAACGGGGGGGSAGASNTGQTDDGVTGVTSQAQTEESVASDTSQTQTEEGATGVTSQTEEGATSVTSQTEGSTLLSHSDISWLIDKSTVRLNKTPGTSGANTALSALPSDYFRGRDALRAEVSKSSPNANLYLNHSRIFGKHEGKAAQNPGDEDYEPGTWIMEVGCLTTPGPGSCYVNSDRYDSFHVIVTEEGELHPYYGAIYRRYSDGRIETCFGLAVNCVPAPHNDVALAVTFEDDTDYQSIATVNGVEMVQTRGVRQGARTVIESDALIDSPVDFVGYGAWMDYSGFFAEGYLYDDTGNGRKQEAAAWTLGIRATGSLPLPATGAFLSWEGAMVGMVVDQAQRQVGDPYSVRDFDPVQGDAEVTIDDAGELRIAFTDIFYLSQPGSIPNFLWDPDDRYGGAYYDENNGLITGTDELRAAFYGPNHEEVAGTFSTRLDNNTTNYLLGAFGAKRVK